MVIKSSAAREISLLLTRLASERDMDREAAVARLSVLGARAVPHLLDVLAGPTPLSTRAAALRTLEAIGDRRSIGPAVAALRNPDSPPELTDPAVAILKSLLASPRTGDAGRAFEELTATILDDARDLPTRRAAVDAITHVDRKTAETLRRRLPAEAEPPDRPLERAAGAADDADALARASQGALPDDPARAKALVETWGPSAPLTTLHRLLNAVRVREASERSAARREWLVVRAAIHQTLAARRSKVALYDLREAFENAREPLPVGFLAAMARLGDAACLEPLAAALANSTASRADWWRQHVASAFQDIVRRERLTRRHAAVRRVLARWPQAAEALPPSRRRR